jgi:hypothetical protein
MDKVDNELSFEDEGATLILVPMGRNPVQPPRNAVEDVFAPCPWNQGIE